MKRILIGAVMGLLLLTGATARAEVQWSYDWATSPLSTTSVTSNSGNSEIIFHNQTLLPGEGTSDIVATNLEEMWLKEGITHDTFTNQNYTLALILKDTESGESTTLLFSGTLNGPITTGSSNVANHFNSPTSYEHFTLGSNTYSVYIGPYNPPGHPDSFVGGIGAHVVVESPEPSTVLLSCLGFSFIGLVHLGKKRFLARTA